MAFAMETLFPRFLAKMRAASAFKNFPRRRNAIIYIFKGGEIITC